MIEGIIFDLGRVLIDIDLTNGLPGYIGRDYPQDIAALIQDSDFIKYCSGKISAEDFYQIVKSKLDLTLTLNEFKTIWCNIFSENQQMQSIVQEIASTKQIGLLSDTDPLHWEYITANWEWINEYFPKPSLSYKSGFMKPAKEAYLDACKKISLPPERCLFIDDMQINIDGAVSAGLQAILFRDANKLRCDLGKLNILPV